MTNPLFSLPKRLEYERPYGQHEGVRRKQNPLILSENADDEPLPTDVHLPKASIYGTRLSRDEGNSETSKNVLTVVGILPHQVDRLRSYFRENGLEPFFDPPDSRSARGNWVSIIFDEDVETLECVRPTIQLSENLIVSCFVGYFQREECAPVVKRRETKPEERPEVFKMRRMDENLAALPMEEKSFLTKMREFLLGSTEIPRRRGTVVGMVSGLLEP